jgi:hypothetical protein
VAYFLRVAAPCCLNDDNSREKFQNVREDRSAGRLAPHQAHTLHGLTLSV